MWELDLLDRKIIFELDLDARQAASTIAKKLKVAKETINFRIKRLLKNEIIKDFGFAKNNLNPESIIPMATISSFYDLLNGIIIDSQIESI